MVSEAALKARRQRDEALANVAERKRDARKKIIIGAALLEAAGSNPEIKNLVVDLISSLADRDRKLFEACFD